MEAAFEGGVIFGGGKKLIRFYCKVWLKALSSNYHQPPVFMSNTTTKSTILYVDDDSDDCVFLKTSVEDAGNKANVICATDGEEAVNYLNSVPSESLPSLIVLDLNMPRWDGKKTLSYLKSHPLLANIPVVILSTSENEKERQKCTQLGAVSYHKKPHRLDEYRGIVANFFEIIQA